MANRRNLVLGGSGTIGTELCKSLIKQGEEVINLDLKNGFDLRFMDLMPYKNVDYLWFLAWEVGGAKYIYNNNNLYDIINNNSLICHNIFSFLKKTKIPFLFTSSQLASSDNTYGITKLLGEEWTKILGGKTVRFWNVYGWEEPSEKSHVIPDIILSALTKKEIRLMTNGQEERQFIYIDDCINNLINVRDIEGEMFHLTNNKWIKIVEIANYISDQTNAKVYPGKNKGYQCKIEADNNYKNFTFNIDIEHGLNKIILEAKDYLKNKISDKS